MKQNNSPFKKLEGNETREIEMPKYLENNNEVSQNNLKRKEEEYQPHEKKGISWKKFGFLSLITAFVSGVGGAFAGYYVRDSKAQEDEGEQNTKTLKIESQLTDAQSKIKVKNGEILALEEQAKLDYQTITVLNNNVETIKRISSDLQNKNSDLQNQNNKQNSVITTLKINEFNQEELITKQGVIIDQKNLEIKVLEETGVKDKKTIALQNENINVLKETGVKDKEKIKVLEETGVKDKEKIDNQYYEIKNLESRVNDYENYFKGIDECAENLEKEVKECPTVAQSNCIPGFKSIERPGVDGIVLVGGKSFTDLSNFPSAGIFCIAERVEQAQKERQIKAGNNSR